MNTLRNVAAFVAAFIVVSITMFALHELYMNLWPEEAMPASTATTEEFRAWMETLSTPMWLTVTDALGYLPVALMTGKWMSRA